MELKHKSFTAASLLTKWVNSQGNTIDVISITSDSGGHNCFYREKNAKPKTIGGAIKKIMGK